MKKYLVTLVPVLMLSFQPDSQTARAPKGSNAGVQLSSGGEDLKPTVSQEKVSQVVSKLLTTYHYRKVRLNDSLSSVVWDNYLKEIDNNKSYLLASDVSSLEKYRTQIDEALVNGDLTPAYDLFNIYRKRFQERLEYVQETLQKPFNFSVDETFNTDRQKATWPKSVEEQNEIWRKLLKNQALELKLSGKKDSAVYAMLRERYKNQERALGRFRSEDVFQIYLNSFTEALDPHTNYLSPRSADRFNQEMSQSLEGIGAMLREDGEYIKIVEVLPGGPAFKSKLLNKEDRIVGVAQGDNGQIVSIVGYQVDDAVKLIKGPKGTVVRLQIQPATALAGAPAKEIRLVREKVKLEEQRAKKEVIEVSENNRTFKIGVVNIPIFYRDFEAARRRDADMASTTSDVKKLIDELKAQKVDGIVIDLRYNGGGSLVEAINLTGLFIPKGPVVQVRESTGETEVYNDPDPSVSYDGPLAVLVNRFSASASEIFAAAIQDYKRGVIVGEQTFGKGTVQQLLDLSQWLPREPEKVGQVKMTVQKFYRINGSSTQHKGVVPDIELPSALTAEEYGESSQPSALPWDQIASTRYEASRGLDEKTVNRLRDKYEQRLKSDPELKQLSQELAEFKKAKQNTMVSLQETKRRKEREEAEKKRAAMNKVTQTGDDEAESDSTTTPSTTTAAPKKKKDLYLNETGRILIDLIAFQSRNQ
ncbi:carboxy terminal-processing peptidase [Nibrella saemangeumensis]|uniref:Carboxy terminal-processing peptidase n=1 Tax=Nibrella saemangeumensis TaxID=1084526 RepID=A0ABP8NF49_9BACT